MNRMFAPAMMIALLGGCSNMPDMPDMLANKAWQGRPALEAVEQFGWPNRVDTVVDKQSVVLVYYRSTSYVRREALGASTGAQNGQLVHTESWGDVKYDSGCEIHVSINRARQVTNVDTRGGYCGSVDIKPNKRA